MVTPKADGDYTDPWVILTADSGKVVVHAMCGPKDTAKGLPKKVDSTFAGSQTIVEIVRRPQGATESPSSEWRAWIAWRAHARTVNLDLASVCSHCGRVISDAGVTPEGLILLAH